MEGQYPCAPVDGRPRHATGGSHRGLLITTGVVVAVLVAAGAVILMRDRTHDTQNAAAAPATEVENVDLQVTPSDTTADVRLDQPVVVHVTAGQLDAVMASS